MIPIVILMASAALFQIDSEVMHRLVAVPGNTTRLNHVLQKSNHREPIIVGFIGGSITQGDSPDRYSTHITRWLQKTFGGTFLEVNAGIGGTGSEFASYRISKDLLSKKPDLIFVEFSVNDSENPSTAFTMESLIRQIVLLPDPPAIVMIGMQKNDGSNAQQFHEPVARHYEIPFLSIRDAIWPYFRDNQLKWEDFYRDHVHPNKEGHALIANLIIEFLKKTAHDNETECLPGLPISMDPDADLFEKTSMLDASLVGDGSIQLIANTGWTTLQNSRHGPAWQSVQAEAELRFSFEGNVIAILAHRAKEGMGDIEVSVNNETFRRIDLSISENYLNNSYVFSLAKNLPDHPHTLTIRHASPGLHKDDAGRVELRMVLVASKICEN